MTEQEKYLGIYGDPVRGKYGHSNHGSKSLAIFDSWAVNSVLDVGCGHNEFAKALRQWPRPWSVVGVDFACPSADVRSEATNLPFFDGQADLVTSFDCLEHLLPRQVDAALAEMARVSKAFVFSISYQPSVNKWKGATLHPTVKPEEWWKGRIADAGGIEIRKNGRYLFGRWEGKPDVTRKSLPVVPPETIILVGNGPSILLGKLGETIDGFDQVCRFNTFKTEGFEEHTGRKTTLWSTFGNGTVPQDAERPLRAVIRGISRPAYEMAEIWRIGLDYWNGLRSELQARSTRPSDHSEIIPSSGFLMARWLLDNGVPKITLAGFDHFQKKDSSLHHYWVNKAFGRPKEHDGDAEAALLQPFVESGRIEYLRSG